MLGFGLSYLHKNSANLRLIYEVTLLPVGSFFFHLIQNGSIPQVALELVTQINNPLICQLFLLWLVVKLEMSTTIHMQI